MTKPGALFVRSLLAAAIAATAATPALAQVTKDEAACRAAIAKTTGKYMKAFGKAVVSCHKKRDLDAALAGSDCNDIAEADTAGKLTKIEESARLGIPKKCEAAPAVLTQFGRCPAPVEDVDDGGSTSGIDDFTELADCLLAQAKVVAGDAASDIMGLPTPPLSGELASCHATLGASYTKLIDSTLKARAKCQKDADKAGGTLGFSCEGVDPGGKLAALAAAAKESITEACTLTGALAGARSARATGLAELGSCATTPEGLADCAVEEEADVAADGAAAMSFELPGVCPGSGAYSVANTQSGTKLDVGWKGIAHDMSPLAGFDAIRFDVSCDADCANCTSSAPKPVADACRCSSNSSQVCSVNADCGAGSCDCFYGPPTSYTAGGVPACVVAIVNGSIAGSLDSTTGEVSLNVPLRQRIYTGISTAHPCPTCTAGVCVGGARNGLACEVDGVDNTFGPVSYDCVPHAGGNITGSGLFTALNLSTSTSSMPFGTKCDSPPTADCACRACSGDSTRGCNSNADCSGAGTCTGITFSDRQPNDCDDGICSPLGSDGDGQCNAGPLDTFCSGLVNAGGGGIIACSSNNDCDAYSGTGTCPGDDCGTCTVERLRSCFLNPIVASGSPGEAIAGVGCLGETANNGVNAVLGLPGAFRLRQNIEFAEGLCSDGVTPFVPPGGSNCP